MQALNFSLDGKLSLSDLTTALENELLVTKNGIHQAAVASFKAEIRYLLLVKTITIINISLLIYGINMKLIKNNNLKTSKIKSHVMSHTNLYFSLLREQLDKEVREKEKIQADLEKAEKLKTQLATEMDEHHSAIEHKNNLSLRLLVLPAKLQILTRIPDYLNVFLYVRFTLSLCIWTGNLNRTTRRN